jgi:predicted site-specific integrase-resolvase
MGVGCGDALSGGYFAEGPLRVAVRRRAGRHSTLNPQFKPRRHGEHSEMPMFFRVSSSTQRVNLENIASHCFSAVPAVPAVVNCFF